MLKPLKGFLHHGVSGKDIISLSLALRKMVSPYESGSPELARLVAGHPTSAYSHPRGSWSSANKRRKL